MDERFDWLSLESYDRRLATVPEAVAVYRGKDGRQGGSYDVSCFASMEGFAPIRHDELPSADGEFID